MKKLLLFILIVVFNTISFAEKPIFSGSSAGKKIALTFDDGPNNESFLRILDLLERENIKGAFFIVGRNIPGAEKSVKRAFDEGHIIANHSYNHPNFKNVSEKEIELEISRTNSAIKKIIGREPDFFRPPYGIVNPNEVTAAKNLGMHTILWNSDGMDWDGKKSPATVSSTMKSQIKPGSILLFHTQIGNRNSYDVLKEMIPYYRSKGYTFVRLDELINMQPYQ